MSSDIAVKVENLSKCYHIYDRPQDRLKQSLLPRLHKLIGKPTQLYHRDFWALRDVSFQIPKGKTIGIIGQNGSGKSTLLQMICGTLTPSAGSIETNGRVAALLELGSGFNLDFSGRDNVFMNAALLGLATAEIEERLEKILEFADIGHFINEPVKSYSSGMIVRLAFAVQAQIDPDVLIVDEALAVGDARFQAKCFDRLKQLKENGTSILLVTHSTEQIVTHCDEAILLNQGEVVEHGTPKDVTNRYMDLLFGRSTIRNTTSNETKITRRSTAPDKNIEDGAVQNQPNNHFLAVNELTGLKSIGYEKRQFYNPNEYRWGDGAAQINDFLLQHSDTNSGSTIESGTALSLYLSVNFIQILHHPILGITIKSKEGVTVYGTNSEILDDPIFREQGAAQTQTIVAFDFLCRLAPGDYFVSVGLATQGPAELIPHDRRYDSIHFNVSSRKKIYGLIDLDVNMKTIR